MTGSEPQAIGRQGESQFVAVQPGNGPWHQLFLEVTPVACCRCLDGNHYPRDWAAPETLDRLEAKASLSDAAVEALRELRDEIEGMDMQATKETDGEWVTGYKFNTGSWHRILGMIRGGRVAEVLARLDTKPEVKP